MAHHEFSIPVGDLDAAGKQFVFAVRAGWMRGALEGHEATTAGRDGELDVRASKSGNDVIVHGTLKAELSVPCARCLEPVRVAIDHPVSVLMVAGPHSRRGKGNEEHELTAEEADTLPYDGETVVLDDFVRDELVLETPMIPLCREDCPGIRAVPQPSESGGSIDPRLLPLMRFKSSTKE
jgi:uncharacterized protein